MKNKRYLLYLFGTIIVCAVVFYNLYSATHARLLVTTPASRLATSSIPLSTTSAAQAPARPVAVPIAPAKTSLAPTPQQMEASAATASPVPAPNVTFDVASSTYRIFAPQGSSVLDAMRSLASSTSFSFTGHDYPGMGIFVDSINGVANRGGKYWFLYVNGASSQTGASQTVLHPGDVVEWRYENNH